MKNLAVHFSSATDDWATPQYLFDQLDAKYGPFMLDVCATDANKKCRFFFNEEMDGLAQDWHSTFMHNNRVWMNPPYGRTIGHWVEKAYRQSKRGCLVCCLLPARTDTRWFHDFIYNKPNVTIEFVKGRLKFGKAKNSAPFPSMVVVFHPDEK